MRKTGTFLVLITMILSSCAPSSKTSDGPSIMRGSTGYFDKQDHGEFIHPNDPYVAARMAEQENQETKPAAPAAAPLAPTDSKTPVTSTPKPKPPAATTYIPVLPANNLTDRVRQFEISRFDAGNATAAVRFGADNATVTVFFKSESPVSFSAKLVKVGAKSHFEKFIENYSISGDLTDWAPDKTTGVFRLTDLKTKDVIEISYRAFKAKLTVHEDVENPVASGSDLRTQIDGLKTGTFGWVNNWTVLNGPAYYLVDMIKIIDNSKPNAAVLPYTPSLAFQGDSKRTATEDQTFEWDAQSLTPETAPKVKLVGNSDEGNGRAFEVTLEDKNSRQTSNILVDVEPENPENQAIPMPDEVPQVDVSVAAPDDQTSGELLPTPETSTAPNPKPKTKPDATQAARVGGDAFIPINMNLSRTARTHRDYTRTLNLRGVQAAIARWQRQSTGNDKGRQDLQNWFDRGWIFRAFAKAVSEALDSNPMWMYISVDESGYLTGLAKRGGGRSFYDIQTGDGGAALGPFQLHVDAAKEGHVKTAGSGPSDERRFFAPSACGAARYLNNQTDAFSKRGDTVLGIAGYNQGAEGARRLTMQYNYSWANLDKYDAGATRGYVRYTNSKLAIYFIANNRQYYKFPVTSGNEVKSYPPQALKPSLPISDDLCRRISAQFF